MSTSRNALVGRLATASVAALLLPIVVAPPAVAELTSSVIDGVLSVVSDDADDAIVVACQGGNVTINQLEPGTGPAPCSSITSIEIAGGSGSDRIDLRQVVPDRFTVLTSVTASGDDGDDRITGTSFADVLRAGAGNDQVVPGGGADSLDGGRGTDDLSLRSSGEVTLTDTSVTDAGGTSSLIGFESADVRASDPAVPVSVDATGFSNPTTLIGSDADDTLIGGPADDLIIAAGGNDRVEGGTGDDILDPGTGESEAIDGGKGSDTLLLRGDGDFTITDDSIAGTATGSLARIEVLQGGGGPGDSRVDASGFSGMASLRGLDGDDVLIGGAGGDSLAGGSGDDRLVGGPGDDGLQGNDGADSLVGGSGDDVLDGGPGKDQCKEGPGTDSVRNC